MKYLQARIAVVLIAAVATVGTGVGLDWVHHHYPSAQATIILTTMMAIIGIPSLAGMALYYISEKEEDEK